MTETIQKEKEISEKEIREGAPYAALSYIFFLWIYTFRQKKNNRFAHFHAKQGIVVFMGEVVSAFFGLIPFIGRFIFPLGLLFFVFMSLYGIYSALSGKMVRLPIISDIADKFVI